MRLWVHRIWLQKNPETVLMTCGPREDKRLETFIHRQPHELVAAYAWWLYVNSDPPAYNLAPLVHIDKFVSQKGNVSFTQKEDTAAITRFPLSAFLAVSQGYEVKALLDYEKLLAWGKERREGLHPKGYLPHEVRCFGQAKDAMEKTSAQIGQKWGKTIEKEPEF